MALRRKSIEGAAKFSRAMACPVRQSEITKRTALEIRDTSAEEREGTVTELRDEENQLAGDQDHLAKINQVVPPAIAAEGVGQRGGVKYGRGALGLVLPELLEFFKLRHGIPPSCAVRWPA